MVCVGFCCFAEYFFGYFSAIRSRSVKISELLNENRTVKVGEDVIEIGHVCVCECPQDLRVELPRAGFAG